MFAPDCIVGAINDYCCLDEVVNVDIACSLGAHWNVDNQLCAFGKGYTTSSMRSMGGRPGVDMAHSLNVDPSCHL